MEKMTKQEIGEVLEQHKLWLLSEREGGKRANLINADLSNVDLTNANLSNACLIDANLTNVNLTNANLINADLSNVDLTNANLTNANLTDAYLINANLTNANLRNANLINADFTNADLTNADLTNAYLTYAIMDNCKGLIEPIEYLNEIFEKEERGYIIYKTFNSQYSAPKSWNIEEKSEIIENDIETDRRETCGPGINVATKKWVLDHYPHEQMWKCLLKFEDAENLKNTVVPYATDGKIRCRKLTILEKKYFGLYLDYKPFMPSTTSSKVDFTV